jgi:hypothetical protein
VNWVTGIEVYVSSGLSRDGRSASGRTQSYMDIMAVKRIRAGTGREILLLCFRTCKNVYSKYVRDNLSEVTFDPKNKLRIIGSSRGLNGKGGKAVGKRARAPDE